MSSVVVASLLAGGTPLSAIVADIANVDAGREIERGLENPSTSFDKQRQAAVAPKIAAEKVNFMVVLVGCFWFIDTLRSG